MEEAKRKELLKAVAARLAIYGLVVASPYIVEAFAGRQEPDTGLIFSAGLNAPMLAFVIMALQFVLRGHFEWIEKPVGAGRVVKFHRFMGVVAGLLILAHPTLMAIGDSDAGVFTRADVPFFMWIGRLVFLLLAAHVAYALAKQAYKLDYQIWLAVHNTVAAVILPLGFYHSMVTEADLAPVAMRAWWTVIFATAVASYIHGKIAEARRRRPVVRTQAAA